MRFPSLVVGIGSDRKRTTGTPKASKLTFLQSSFKLCRFRKSYDANFFQMCINSLYGKALTPSTLCCKSAKFDEFLNNANCFFFLFFLAQVFYVYFIMLHFEIITSTPNEDPSSGHLYQKRKTKPEEPVPHKTISFTAPQNRPVVLSQRTRLSAPQEAADIKIPGALVFKAALLKPPS